MTTSLVDAESVLAIDIGSIHTRALLFDIVDGQYRFIGASRASSTANAPFYDISEGIHQALVKLEEITARLLLDEARLVLPSRPDGVGVDQFVLTFSAGQTLRIAVMGLLEDVSLESAKRLASSAHSKIVESIGLNDRRKPEMQIDAILQSKSDLVVIAGGTEQGATRSIAKMVDLLNLTMQIVPRDKRPEVIYAGNQALAKHVQDSLSKYTEVRVAPNIRPAIDVEFLTPAQEVYAESIRHIRTRQLGGLQSYASICSVEPVPSSLAFGRTVRFLSQINNPNKGVLGVDLGGGNVVVAGAKEGRLDLSVQPFGLGSGLNLWLETASQADIARWLPMHVPEAEVRDYLWQKTLRPGTVPASQETLAIEQAAARQILISALQQHRASYPRTPPVNEPIVASGLALSQNNPGQSLLMLLDSLQPLGITTFILDPYGLTTALGAAAAANTLLPVHVVESNAYLNLGTVISPLSNAKYGTPILRVKIEYEVGEQVSMEVRQGGITVLPIQPGQAARVHLQPLRPLSIDPTRKDGARSFKILGGACGAVIDTRGRPLQIPRDAARRRDLLKKWAMALSN